MLFYSFFRIPGVDLVLNSLAGEKLKASLRCLAPHGRFLEIGMFDLAKNTDLGMAALMKNVSFCVVHIDALHFNTPTAIQEKRRVCELLREGVATGTVRPLSSVVFPRTQAEEAFRFMASGKHIGKVVLEVREVGSLDSKPIFWTQNNLRAKHYFRLSVACNSVMMVCSLRCNDGFIFLRGITYSSRY
ncbi:hypothetical protein HPB48_022386 [Haemaphysalis longicornis]|uniref:Enoyl reductase (ER) domain-containing protein n=1 Tax=Haemaphysalis longicornis TaxID=44386 RepID=A0A9J6GIT9_HAELO|nr:hypothetical protein HPB48_022386 [Haemaphysalis longicornis]